MDNMDSLSSEGITFKKPNQNKSRARLNFSGKKKQSSDPKELDLDVLRTYEGPHETILKRSMLCSDYINMISEHLMRQQERSYEKLGIALDGFIKNSFLTLDKDENVLPIGILQSGLSMSENSAIFNYIQERLTKTCTSNMAHQNVYVARVQSGTCPSTKAVFQKICRQIISNIDEISDQDEYNFTKHEHFSLFDVKSYLRTQTQTSESKFKIVILVEDADYFSNTVVSQLLTLMGSSKLPIVFIFGATHSQFLNNVAHTGSSFAFVIEKFFSVSSNDILDDFMKHILFDSKYAFRISGPIVAYLESHYSEENFSVNNIFNAIKFCIRSHFLTAASGFCTFDESNEFQEAEIDLLKSLHSSSQSCDESPRKRQKLKAKDIKIESVHNSSVEKIRLWYIILRLLRFINLWLPNCPLGSTNARIYISCYGGFTLTKESKADNPFQKLFYELSSLSNPELKKIIDGCTTFLTSKIKKEVESGLVHQIVEKLSAFLEEITKDEQKTVATTPEESAIINKPLRLKRRNQNLQDLQKSLLEAKRQTDGTSTFYKVRENFVEELKILLKKSFPPFTSLPLSNLYVFSDLAQLVRSLFPANFLQLNEDITNPRYVLQCTCCSSLDSASVDSTLPDVAIMHKLMVEHTTKKVDLNSIYHAFISIIGTIQEKRKTPMKTDYATPSHLIRFRLAVGELQHMGFIKRSKSKPDEISRLTWW